MNRSFFRGKSGRSFAWFVSHQSNHPSVYPVSTDFPYAKACPYISARWQRCRQEITTCRSGMSFLNSYQGCNITAVNLYFVLHQEQLFRLSNSSPITTPWCWVTIISDKHYCRSYKPYQKTWCCEPDCFFNQIRTGRNLTEMRFMHLVMQSPWSRSGLTLISYKWGKKRLM